jgi:hypothetical protein
MSHRTDEGGSAQHSTSVIAGWNDIGRYLGKGKRTVQRWERELGLPVRRTHEGRKSGVLAIPAEIDAWVHTLGLRDDRKADRTSNHMLALIHSLRELRAENQELRRQLGAERSKRQ